MIPLNTNYPNPNYYSIRGRVSYQWFRQGFTSPIVYSTWSWPNYIPVQGRAQRSQLVSYCPSRPIYTSYGYCGWKGTDAVYSSQGFGEIVEGTHGVGMFDSNQFPSYTSCCRYHGRGHFDRNSWMNMYNDNRFDHPTGSTHSNVIYLRSNPATINVTRQPTSAFIQPSSLPMPVANNAVNFRGTVALGPPVPPLIRPDIIEDDESLDHFYGSFERQELDGKPVSTSGENSPQATQQSSFTTIKCRCDHCTDTPFCDESSDQSDTESASTYATGDGWNSPVSPSYVSAEPVDLNDWNNYQGSECFGNYQDSYFSQTTASPPMYWPKPQHKLRHQQQAQLERQYPILVAPQFYQRSMSAYGPNPQVLCQQQNYIGFQYVCGQYIQMMPYRNNAMMNQQAVAYGTPLHLEIPEVAFVQLLTNGSLEQPIQQPSPMQDFRKEEDWNANQMLLKICPRSPIPRNYVPEVWEQEYEQLPNYDDLVMPGSPRVSRYFPTVPVECARTENAATFPACPSPTTFNKKAHSLAVMQHRPPVSVHQSKYIPHQVPHLQRQVRSGLIAGAGMHHANEEISPASFMDDSMSRMGNETLYFEELNDHRSISFTAFRNYYDTHNQPDGVAGNSSTGMQSTPNGNVGGASSSTTMQRAPPAQQQYSGMGFSGSQQRQQYGRRGERDSDVSNITLRTLLETPYSPRTRNARNLELEEYQRMMAEEELQKKLDALKAKENADKNDKNGSKYNNGKHHG